MTPQKEAFSLTAKTIISNLEKRNMEGYYAESSKDAVSLITTLLPKGATVTHGGSETLKEAGIIDLFKNGEYRYIDRSTFSMPDEKKKLDALTICADAFFMSSNAITIDGELINTDGTGNRISYLIYGPESVFIIVGMNKVVLNTDEGISRVRNIASPPNTVRLHRNTPCSQVGYCKDCQSPDCICCQTVITRRSSKAGRIKVILIAESLGF